MVFRQCCNDVVFVQQLRRETGMREWHVCDGNLDLLTKDVLNEVVGAHRVQYDEYFGMPLTKRSNRVWQKGLTEIRAAADAHDPRTSGDKFFCDLIDALHAVINSTDLFEKTPCFWRGIEPSLDAFEQLEANALLGIGDQPADCRLRNMQRLGRPTD